MRTRFLILIVLAVPAGLIYTLAAAQNRPALPNAEADAIQKATQSYADAFTRGDLDGVLAAWASDAEYIDEAGRAFKGREAIGEYLKMVLKEAKGAKMTIKSSTIRFVKDDVALQDGSVLLTMANNESESNPFSALWIKKDGKWQLMMVRDTTGKPVAVEAEPTQTQVKDLAWLRGEWTTQDKETKTSLSVHWMKGDKFLEMKYSIVGKDGEIIAVTQIIGWDPASGRLHSWVFDSKGGLGEGSWSRRENTWIDEVEGVTADGRHGSGTHRFTKVDDNAFTFEGLDRELDGQAIPNVKVTYQRTTKPNQ